MSDRSSLKSLNLPVQDENHIDTFSDKHQSEISCTACDTVGEHAVAKGFCVDCEEYLCFSCFRSHSRSSASKEHTLLKEDAMPRPNDKYSPCNNGGNANVAKVNNQTSEENMCGSRSERDSQNVILTDKSGESDRFVSSSTSRSSIADAEEEFSLLQENGETVAIVAEAGSDKNDCLITGMTLVSENKLVLCDSENKSLKLADIEKCFIEDVLELQACPQGITTISTDEVAVVYTVKCNIQIISTSGRRLSKGEIIRTNGECLNVDVVNENLYVSFRKPVKFQIFQPAVESIKTIRPDPEVFQHCSYPRHFTVNPAETLIYVSDRKENKVLSIDMNGNLISLYDDVLEYPSAIKISPFGSIYICHRHQNIVYKMTPDLREAKVMLVPGDLVLKPQALCFNVEKQHLYITSACEGLSNIIMIYQWRKNE